MTTTTDESDGAAPAPETMAATPRVSPFYAGLVAFFSGMCVMAVELSASRLVAPWFGTTAFVWTNVIGCIMVALSVGYLLGGRLADRRPDLRVLLRLLAGASIFLVFVPFLAPPLVESIAGALRGTTSAFTFLVAGSFAAITLLFVPPILVMGMTGPFLVRLLASDRNVGDSAGRVFGLSTAGSILGTFLPILVFIPRIGTSRTIILFALVLLVVASAGLASPRLWTATVLAGAFLALPAPTLRSAAGRIFSTESAYQFIEVRDDGDFRLLAYNDASGFQTVARRGGGATGFYFDVYPLVPFLVAPPAPRVLVVGLGGGTIANEILRVHPKASVDGVEIDPEVVSIARRWFDLSPAVRVHAEDGRIFLAGSGESWDVVVVDAYAQQVYIPFHLATAEFFREVRRHLSPGGVVAMNVASPSDGSLLLRSVVNTLAGEFPHVARFRLGESPSTVVLASDRPLDLSRLERTRGTPLAELAGYAAARLAPVPFDPTLPRLTDDRAPIEHLVDRELIRAGS